MYMHAIIFLCKTYAPKWTAGLSEGKLSGSLLLMFEVTMHTCAVVLSSRV